MKKVFTKDIFRLFSITLLNEEHADLSKEIKGAAIQRAGLKLAGVKIPSDKNDQIIGWGTKERVYLKSLGKAKAIDALKNIFQKDVPLIILSVGFDEETTKWVIEIANKYEIPVASTGVHLAVSVTTISSYLIHAFAETVDVHASLVVINAVGVMITGNSGIGKSEAVLELIQSGHFFVSDDTVVLRMIGEKFVGCAAQITEGFLEARGIGIIDIPTVYGLRSIKKSTTVELVVELVETKDDTEIDRLGIANLSYDVLSGHIPLMKIPVNKGKNIASLIQAAVNVHLARAKGHDPMSIISKRTRSLENEPDQ